MSAPCRTPHADGVPCARLWAVEAVRDGRLTDTARAQAVLHIAACAACTAEQQALDALGAQLGTLPSAVPQPLRLKRSRARLLEALDALQTGRDGSTLSRPGSRAGAWALGWPQASARRVGIAAAVAAVAAIAVGAPALLGHRGPEVRPLAAPPISPPLAVPSQVEARGEGDARYVRRVDGATEYVTVLRGTVHLHADHGADAAGRHRLRVELPDGELEDLGTTFDVTVTGEQTTRIAVTEGAVVARLRGEPEFRLEAGGSWSRATAAAPAQTSAPSAAQGLLRVPLASSAVAARPTGSEDAEYLHILQLLRSGHRAEAREAARAYLRAYPDGFRRRELGPIAE